MFLGDLEQGGTIVCTWRSKSIALALIFSERGIQQRIVWLVTVRAWPVLLLSGGTLYLVSFCIFLLGMVLACLFLDS